MLSVTPFQTQTSMQLDAHFGFYDASFSYVNQWQPPMYTVTLYASKALHFSMYIKICVFVLADWLSCHFMFSLSISLKNMHLK